MWADKDLEEMITRERKPTALAMGEELIPARGFFERGEVDLGLD